MTQAPSEIEKNATLNYVNSYKYRNDNPNIPAQSSNWLLNFGIATLFL